MKNYFETELEAIAYKEKHQLHAMVAEYLEVRGKWALVFPIKAHVQVVTEPH